MIGNAYSGPTRVAGGRRRGASDDRWKRGFHATRSEHLSSILEHGLVLGGANKGVMKTPAGGTPWPNVAYGCHPIFVFLSPSYRSNYSWINADGNLEDPVWLRVDLDGIALYADFWELREVTKAAVSSTGFWWGSFEPIADRAPLPLQPYIDSHGVVPYEALLDKAAAGAIETTDSAAVLSPIEAERIAVL